ncbi:MAG: hypothetical protein RI985_1953 [Chloroflexota bacterium]
MDDVTATTARLFAFPDQVRALVRPLSHAQMTFRPHTNEWSVIEHIGHLVEIERHYITRVDEMLHSDHPQFATFNIDEDVRAANYHTKSITDVLQLFGDQRALMLAKIQTLSFTDLRRTTHDDYFGEITLARLLDILANHDMDHYTHIHSYITNHVMQLRNESI